MASDKRVLPNRVNTHQTDGFDNHLATVFTANTPARAQRYMIPGWTAMVVMIGGMLGGLIGAVSHAHFGLHEAFAWGIAIGTPASALGFREAVIALAGGRRANMVSAHSYIVDERIPEMLGLKEILQARKSIRIAALGPAGSQISDELLETIEDVCFEVVVDANAVQSLRSESWNIHGEGVHATATKDRLWAEVDARVARIERLRDAVAAVAVAADEAHLEYTALAAAGLDALGDPADLVEAQLVSQLTAAIDQLHAAAAAARTITELAAGDTPAMREVTAAIDNAVAVEASALQVTAKQ